jgi:uncharacterized protein involved in exopolysaccharide biosynthesis
MEEVIHQVMTALRGMWRRRWIGLAVAWAVAVIGAVVLLRIPDRYEATARVFVDTQTPSSRDRTSRRSCAAPIST